MTKPLIPVTVAHGDGIGPEIMHATLAVLDAANAPLRYDTIEIGEQVYLQGFNSGIKPEAWESLRHTKVCLKAPITTPQGGGVKSLNVTLRKTLGLYANVRPCVSYNPYIKTKHPNMDVVIVRENEEDLYGGIEHQQSQDVVQCLKLISRPGCERIVRYAFEYARHNQRRKVTCFSKDNIMKLTDGLFHRVFDEIASEYSDIEANHMIIDIGTAKLANTPESFDVIVTPNLYGDIISDVAAEITGSVGLGGSANIGDHCAMFEAIHGSAPDIAGQGIANPSGLLLGSVMMLVHLNQGDIATHIHNAWLKTIESGVHTGDIYNPETSVEKVNTEQFTQAVIKNLGKKPERFQAVQYQTSHKALHQILVDQRSQHQALPPKKRELIGVDIFLCWPPGTGEELAERLNELDSTPLTLQIISNRGTKVWPEGQPETFCVDHWRCRFLADQPISAETITRLLDLLIARDLECIKTENLYLFDGQPAFSKAQGS